MITNAASVAQHLLDTFAENDRRGFCSFGTSALEGECRRRRLDHYRNDVPSHQPNGRPWENGESLNHHEPADCARALAESGVSYGDICRARS